MYHLSSASTKNFLCTALLSAILFAVTFLPYLFAFKLHYQSAGIAPKSFTETIKDLSYWDSNWYSSIVDRGYVKDRKYADQTNLAWPFLYPAASKIIKAVFSCSAKSAQIIVSNLSLLVFIFCALKIGEFFNWSLKDRITGLILFLLSPYSLFLHIGYSEAFFLMFMSLAFLSILKRRLLLAAAFFGLSSLVRTVGLFFILFPIVNFISSHLIVKRDLVTRIVLIRHIIMALIVAGCFMLNFIYTYFSVGDPFAIFNAQEGWRYAYLNPVACFFDAFKSSNFFLLEGYSIFILLLVILVTLALIFKTSKQLLVSSTTSETQQMLMEKLNFLAISLLTVIPVFLKFNPGASGRYTLPFWFVFLLIPQLIGRVYAWCLILLSSPLLIYHITRVLNQQTPY